MEHYVIIIGSMKSGTTTLFNLLAEHPEIAPASNKEPGFFAFEDIWSKGWHWYHALFDFNPSVHRYRLEATTDYTKYPFVTGVWDRMTSRKDVSVKLIYLMRHPFRRIESHARHVQTARKELGQIVSPRPDHSLDAGISLINLAASQYATQINVFQAALNTGKLHLLTLEDLKHNPDNCLADIYRFLELAPVENPRVLPIDNAASTKLIIHPIWVRLSRIRSLMAIGRALLPDAMRDRIVSRMYRPIQDKGRFILSDEEERHLRGLLGDEMWRLNKEHGIPIDQLWGYDPPDTF